MTQPTRMFECLEMHLEANPIRDMLTGKENGNWRSYSTQEVNNLVHQLSLGLLRIGISGQDRTEEGMDKVAIISKNRPEWLMVDAAVQQAGAVLTPIYPTISVGELEFILNDAQARIIFVNDEELFYKVLSVRSAVPSIREIYTFEHVVNARHWKELLAQPSPEEDRRLAAIRETIRDTDLATIIYTSGTTGVPKGVMLSHRNIISGIRSSDSFLPSGVKRILSFLPLNHIYERAITYFWLAHNTAIYYAESMDKIGENLKEVKPQMFATVPRLLEKVYERIMTTGGDLKGTKRKLFFWAHDLAVRYEINKPMGRWYDLQLSLANRLIFRKWREALGNNLIAVISGGAACQVRLIRVFTAAGIPIVEGYGLTETSAIISVNRIEEKDRAFGTVGPVVADVEARIAEDGEILCKGPNVMMGYYKRPDLTAEAIIDGWFHTGDIGEFEGRFLKITDRKKELFKTSGGKYVAPLAIESKLKESPYVEQIMIVGPDRKFVGALIVPAFANLRKWATKEGIANSKNEELIANPKVLAIFREVIDTYNKYFTHSEQIKRFELLPQEWTVETGEMTPKLSLRRKVVADKFHDSIEKIYS